MPNSDDGDSLERRCKYAVISRVLFKPFRLLDDLISPSEGSDEQHGWGVLSSGSRSAANL
jgi:hypothetical protein